MFIEGLGCTLYVGKTSLISPEGRSGHPHGPDRKLQPRDEKQLAEDGTARRCQSQDSELHPSLAPPVSPPPNFPPPGSLWARLVPFATPCEVMGKSMDLVRLPEAGPGVGGGGCWACLPQAGPWSQHVTGLLARVTGATPTCLGGREAVLTCTQACAAHIHSYRKVTSAQTHTWHHHGRAPYPPRHADHTHTHTHVHSHARGSPNPRCTL